MARRQKFRFYAIKICLIIVLCFILQIFFPIITELGVLNKSAFTEPWRFFTPLFLHGSWPHVLYNIFALGLFGSILERLIGGKRFIKIFFITGILVNMFTVAFYNSSLGASGAIFGIIGALMVIRPWMVVWAFSLPMPMIFAGIIWAVGDMIGLFMPSEVANLAHIFGMFLGFFFGFLYKKKALKLIKK